MYFYTISTGAFEDYIPLILYHEKQFSEVEFISLYNNALLKLKEENFDNDILSPNSRDILHIFKTEYGFENVTTLLEISSGDSWSLKLVDANYEVVNNSIDNHITILADKEL